MTEIFIIIGIALAVDALLQSPPARKLQPILSTNQREKLISEWEALNKGPKSPIIQCRQIGASTESSENCPYYIKRDFRLLTEWGASELGIQPYLPFQVGDNLAGAPGYRVTDVSMEKQSETTWNVTYTFKPIEETV